MHNRGTKYHTDSALNRGGANNTTVNTHSINNTGTITEYLNGIVERITYHNPDNGWSVLRVVSFNNPHQQETVVVHQTKIFAGATMKFEGFWTVHPRYGRQFRATMAEEKKPATTAALEKYLGSGLIKGVGPKTAKKIVRHFDKKTLDVFESEIERLTEIPGIAHKKLEMIRNAWIEHKSIRDVMIFLQSHGISTLFAVRIYKEYGDNSIEYVTQDPYRLAIDFYGIGFFSADRVALSIGFAPDCDKRIIAAIRHILAASRNFGHCYLTLSQINEQVKELLGFDLQHRISEILDHMQKEKLLMVRSLCIAKETDSDRDLHQTKEFCYYSRSLYFDELYVAKRVSAMCMHNPVVTEKERVDRWISLYCKAKQISLSQEQARAVSSIVFKKFSILTGGPGCGKTTTTFVIVKLIEAMGNAGGANGVKEQNVKEIKNQGLTELQVGADIQNRTGTPGKSVKILLTAPTGRAAQRMSEVIGKEAKTIHRLLEWQGGEFKKNEKTPLKADFLIVDECSMLDISLTASLLKAVPESCQVLFIGDADQLPSVGAGNVLKDMIASKVVPCFVLTQIFRQAEESLIIKYAHQMNKGAMPWIASPFKAPEIWQNSTDCMFIDSDEVTKEQIHFITQVKKAYNLKSSELDDVNVPEPYSVSILKPDNIKISKSDVTEVAKSYSAKVSDPDPVQLSLSDETMAEQDSDAGLYEFGISETVKPYETEIKIPKKFQHVDLAALYSAGTEVRELITVLKKVHPWSSLHYGYAASDVVRELYQEWIPKYYGNGCEIQILSPMIRGTLGTMNLNQVIQASANPATEKKRDIRVGERIFRTGDRVIHRRNNYDLGVFNGDIGTIVDIDIMEPSCSVAFYPDSRVVHYQRDDILELDLAYAITIHKSQGSEFDIVIIPVLSQHFRMLFRNLIYTGLTRAKKLAVFVGTRKAMAMAVKNQDTTLRQTALEELLRS